MKNNEITLKLSELDLLIEALNKLKDLPESDKDKEFWVGFRHENDVVNVRRSVDYRYVDLDGEPTLKAFEKNVFEISVRSLDD